MLFACSFAKRWSKRFTYLKHAHLKAEWGIGIFSINSTGKGFISFIYKELLNINKKKTNMPARGKKKKMGMDLNRIVTKVNNKIVEDIQHE